MWLHWDFIYDVDSYRISYAIESFAFTTKQTLNYHVKVNQEVNWKLWRDDQILKTIKNIYEVAFV